MAFYWRCYVPRPEVARVPLSARIARGVAARIAAGDDHLGGVRPAPHDQGVGYAERLRADGVPVDLKIYAGMIHAFFSFMDLFEQGREAVVYAGRAVGNALGAQTASR